jgi:RNA polymerase sigma-32 factor
MESRLANLDTAFDGSDGDEDEAPSSPSACLPDLRMEPARILERDDAEANQRARLRSALTSLDARSREILTKRWLCEKKQTLQELAGQFGVSAERIRQIEKNAISKLKVQIGV